MQLRNQYDGLYRLHVVFEIAQRSNAQKMRSFGQMSRNKRQRRTLNLAM